MLTILLNKTKRNSFLCERNTTVKEQRGVFRAAFKQDLITSLELTRKWCFNNCRETNGTRKLIKTCVLKKEGQLSWHDCCVFVSTATRLGVKADAQMLVHALCYLVDFLTYLEISDIYTSAWSRKKFLQEEAGSGNLQVLWHSQKPKAKKIFFANSGKKKCKKVAFYEVIQFSVVFSNWQFVCLCSVLNKRVTKRSYQKRSDHFFFYF